MKIFHFLKIKIKTSIIVYFSKKDCVFIKDELSLILEVYFKSGESYS